MKILDMYNNRFKHYYLISIYDMILNKPKSFFKRILYKIRVLKIYYFYLDN